MTKLLLTASSFTSQLLKKHVKTCYRIYLTLAELREGLENSFFFSKTRTRTSDSEIIPTWPC